MNVQQIACKLIQFPKVSGRLRKFSEEFATNLAHSIRDEGMYNAIVVRPNPSKPGYYLGVQGKHRLYATAKVLKREFIEAKVIPEMDDTDAEHARITENLWRNPLTKAQLAKALKRWWKDFAAKHPDRVGRGIAGGKATKRKAEERREAREAQRAGDETKTDGDPAAAGGDGPVASVSDGNFAEMVAAATGQSVSSAKRSAKIARAFSEEQLEVFDQMEISQADMEKIAGNKDAGKRAEIVALIASGMEAPDAIKEVMGDPAPARDDGRREAETGATVGQRAGGEARSKLDLASGGEDGHATAERVGDPAEVVDAATDRPVARAEPSDRPAGVFDDDQLEVFFQMGVSQADRERIAAIGDPARRAEIIDRIASNVEACDAIEQVLGAAALTGDDGASRAEAGAKGAAGKVAAEMSDDEWFDAYCGEKGKMLGDPTKFKAGALLYHRLGEERHAHRKKVKKLLAAAEKAGMVEPYFLFIDRYLSVSHPKDWYICNQCRGSGGDGAGGECRKCRGGGYEVKVEKYL